MAVENLRVVIAAGDPLVRAGLRAVVSAEPGCDVIAETGIDVDDGAVPMAAAPDVILADVGEHAAAETMSALTALGVPLLVLVSNPGMGRAALGAGAHGAVTRDAGGDRLAAALRAVAAGLQVSEPMVRLPEERDDRAEERVEELTPRESETLQLLAAGLSNKEIARRLRISEHTAKFHVAAIMSKLGTHSRTETVARAARAGLIVF